MSPALGGRRRAAFAAPAVSNTTDTSGILGMGKVGEQLKTVLDLDKVLSQDELVGMMAEAGR